MQGRGIEKAIISENFEVEVFKKGESVEQHLNYFRCETYPDKALIVKKE